MLIITTEENVSFSEMDSLEVTCGVALFIQTLAVKLMENFYLFYLYSLRG